MVFSNKELVYTGFTQPFPLNELHQRVSRSTTPDAEQHTRVLVVSSLLFSHPVQWSETNLSELELHCERRVDSDQFCSV